MRSKSRVLLMLIGTSLAALLAPTTGAAQTVTRLQVLLPGETAAPGTVTGKIGVPSAQTVGVSFQVRVRACDSQWQTVPGSSDIVRLTSSDASAGLPDQAPLSGGEGTFMLTFNAAGTFTVSATDVSDPTLPVAVSSPVSALVLQGFVFGRISQKNQYAGQPMTIELRAVDPAGQTVSGYSGAVLLQQLTSYGPGRIAPETITLSGGVWTGQITCYRADETSINRGNVNIYAFLSAQPGKNGTSDPFTVHPGPLARVQVVVPGQDPAPGSVSGVTGSPATQSANQDFTVDLFGTDAWWNQVATDHTVRLTSSDPLFTPMSRSLSVGWAQATLRLGTVGDQTLTIVDQSSGSIQGMTSAAIPVIPSGASRFEFDPLPASVQAGEPITVRIRATDSAGNTLPSYHGDARLSANTGAGSISPDHITLANGVWSGPVVFRGAGASVTLTCADYASPPHTGLSPPIQVLAGPWTRMQVLLPGQQPQGGTATGFSGLAEDQAAGTPFTIRVRAVDTFFNRVPDASPSVTLTSSDPNLTAPGTVQLAGGEASVQVTLYRGGPQTITATPVGGGAPAGTSTPVTVLGGPYSRLLILAPGEEVSPGAEDGRSGTATDQSISFAFTVTVLATDAWWNPVGGVTDRIHITTSDPMAQLPPDENMVDGMAEMVLRLSTGGYQQITASNVTGPSRPPSTTQVRAISSGLHLEATVSPTTVQAGAAFTLTVRAVNDAGSVIQEINSSVRVEVRNASSQEPGRGTLLNTEFQLLQGQRSVPQTYTCAEPIVMMITDDAGNSPAITNVLNVQPGAPASLTLTAQPSWVRGNRHAEVTASVEDLFGNGVPYQPVAFSLVSGAGELTAMQDSTGQAGTALADYLSSREQGTARIAASCRTLAALLDIPTAFVDPAAGHGTLTSYPNPFLTGEAPMTIAYVLDWNAQVRLRLFTLSGSLVLDRNFAPGELGGRTGLNEIRWDGRNGENEWVASGGYILLVEAVTEGTSLTMRRKIGVVR